MDLCANRGQSLNMKDFIDIYERNSKKNLDELVFRALLSIHPEAYNVEITSNDLYVTMVGCVKPSNLVIKE
jgi:hypothetical protein